MFQRHGRIGYRITELVAAEHIFNELSGEKGILVASKIADRAGISR